MMCRLFGLGAGSFAIGPCTIPDFVVFTLHRFYWNNLEPGTVLVRLFVFVPVLTLPVIRILRELAQSPRMAS